MKWENMALKCFIKRYRDTMIVFILFIINLKLINLTKKNYDNTNYKNQSLKCNGINELLHQELLKKFKKWKRCWINLIWIFESCYLLITSTIKSFIFKKLMIQKSTYYNFIMLKHIDYSYQSYFSCDMP